MFPPNPFFHESFAMLKKTLSALALAVVALSSQAADVLKVAATAVPHAELLQFVKPQLQAQGVELQVREFSDYVQPNAAVEDKQLDANFFQHQPFLDNAKKETDFNFIFAEDKTFFGHTIFVQDIYGYSNRDYGKLRDMNIGMLPPKLAQMMINLSSGTKIYDPFV